jgi:hypothetical protein
MAHPKFAASAHEKVAAISPAGKQSHIFAVRVSWKFRLLTVKSFGMMVARDGVEPPTPAFSGLYSPRAIY